VRVYVKVRRALARYMQYLLEATSRRYKN